MRILIVEDDFASRMLLQNILRDYGQCDVAVDGSEAVEAFLLAHKDQNPYDLILLDIMMPNLNGHEVLEKIRQVEADKGLQGLDGVKVIMTTALSDGKNVFKAFREQCEGYLVKPINKEKLMAEISNLGLPLPETSAE